MCLRSGMRMGLISFSQYISTTPFLWDCNFVLYKPFFTYLYHLNNLYPLFCYIYRLFELYLSYSTIYLLFMSSIIHFSICLKCVLLYVLVEFLILLRVFSSIQIISHLIDIWIDLFMFYNGWGHFFIYVFSFYYFIDYTLLTSISLYNCLLFDCYLVQASFFIVVFIYLLC